MTDNTEDIPSTDEPGKTCPTCGAGEAFTVVVWENVEDYENGDPPDHIGCRECHTMHTIDPGADREREYVPRSDDGDTR